MTDVLYTKAEIDALFAAIPGGGSGGRILLRSPLSLFADPAGSDSNDGLTAATPKKNRQAIWDLLLEDYDLGGLPNAAVTINMAATNFTDPFTALGPLVGARGAESCVWQGVVGTGINATAPGQCGWIAGEGAKYRIMTQGLVASGAGADGILVGDGEIQYGGVVFSTCGESQISLAGNKANVKQVSPCVIAGASKRHLCVESGAQADLTNGQLTAWAGVSYSDVAVLIDGGAMLSALAFFQDGVAINCKKFRAETLARLYTGTAGVNLPGNQAGSVSSGAQVW